MFKKKELCEYNINNPTKTYEEIGKKFGIGDWPQLEEALAIWVNLANEANHTITGAILSQKATQFAQRPNISDFKSSQESINFFECNM
ncbi:5579_t:CDS:2 [Entrophospora sp. SA101]|nr:5579_t:CDS:2 [Entrophospora sp. SA101]